MITSHGSAGHGFLIIMSRVITGIQSQKRNKQRLNISLDGEYAFSLDRLTAAWLKEGQALSEAQVRTLQEKDEKEIAWARALHFLSFRSRSRQEMAQYLQKKGYESAAADQVIDRLTDEGFLDDARFAQDWIENRNALRPRGERLLRRELQQKGLAEEVIELAFQKSGKDENALAFQAGEKVARRYKDLPWDLFLRRLVNSLQRKGFSYSTSHDAATKIWRDLHDGVEDNN